MSRTSLHSQDLMECRIPANWQTLSQFLSQSHPFRRKQDAYRSVDLPAKAVIRELDNCRLKPVEKPGHRRR